MFVIVTEALYETSWIGPAIFHGLINVIVTNYKLSQKHLVNAKHRPGLL